MIYPMKHIMNFHPGHHSTDMFGLKVLVLRGSGHETTICPYDWLLMKRMYEEVSNASVHPLTSKGCVLHNMAKHLKTAYTKYFETLTGL